MLVQVDKLTGCSRMAGSNLKCALMCGLPDGAKVLELVTIIIGSWRFLVSLWASANTRFELLQILTGELR